MVPQQQAFQGPGGGGTGETGRKGGDYVREFTIWFDGNLFVCEEENCQLGKCPMVNPCERIQDAIDRLAAYEDSSLEPEAIPATDVEQTKWVSVQERLPDQYQKVLLYFDTGSMAVGFFSHKIYWGMQINSEWHTYSDIPPIYWCPLPQPPKEGLP